MGETCCYYFDSAYFKRLLQLSLLCPPWGAGDAGCRGWTGDQVGVSGAPWILPLTTIWATETIFTKTSCPAWAGLFPQLHPRRDM